MTLGSLRLILAVLLGTAAAALTPLGAQSQQSAKLSARVAFLSAISPPDNGFEAFRQELRELGYTEGKNLVLEARWAHGQLARLPELATELVRLRPDVIYAAGEQALSAAKRATSDTPIVVFACDPLDRFIVSLAAPGGSATGLTCIHSELAGKRLELLKELIPGLARAAVLYNPTDPNKRLEFSQVEAAGRQLAVTIRAFEVADAEGIAEVFAALSAARAQALLVLVDPFMFFHRRKLAELALQWRVPAIFGFKEFVEAGGLMSYGASRPTLVRRAAGYVDKILKGAKPSDLPVEQPTTFELYINRRAADALGLTVPPSILARADELIE